MLHRTMSPASSVHSEQFKEGNKSDKEREQLLSASAQSVERGLEPSADVIVSAAARWSILVGVGGGATAVQRGVVAQKCFFKDSRKLLLYPQNFLIENCNKISTQQLWHR